VKRAVRVQYGALPYRFNHDAALEILLVTARQSKQWIIPKGWPIKGLRPAKSAAREAFEEAGVRGRVGAKSIGLFAYDKSLDGNGIRVSCGDRVFSLLVKRQSETWPEIEQRVVQWVAPDKALTLIRDPELKALTGAVGMAAGAGLPILAIAATCGHFIVVFVFPAIERHLPKSRGAASPLHISYEARRGALREILAVCTNQEFSVSRVQVDGKPSGAQAGKGHGTGWEDHPEDVDVASLGDLPREGIVTLLVEVRGAKPVGRLAARLTEIAGVTAVRIGDGNHASD
jgi:8-oxo-dGTP pyrophosphatase MutT (NUDIX family)